MKPTGIIRRIDDIGRIAIPKAVRLALDIEDNEPLEIFIIDDGILLKKYKPMDDAVLRITDTVKAERGNCNDSMGTYCYCCSDNQCC